MAKFIVAIETVKIKRGKLSIGLSKSGGSTKNFER